MSSCCVFLKTIVVIVAFKGDLYIDLEDLFFVFPIY